MPRSFRFIFPPWLAALKTIETQTPVHLVDLLIDLRDLFRIASGGGKKLYNLLLNYRVDHSPFFPSISFNDELQRIPKGSLIFSPLSVSINFMEKHRIRFVYSKLKEYLFLTNYSIKIWETYKNCIFLQISRTLLVSIIIFFPWNGSSRSFKEYRYSPVYRAYISICTSTR